jgi:hypothetical protein
MEFNGVLTLHDEFEPQIWGNGELNEAVKDKLIVIAEDFFNNLDLEEVELEDITFTGSLANYNWTKYSDIDLHMIVDFSEVDENIDLVREYFRAKTSNWNKNHNIVVYGYEIELYVQHSGEKHHSSGVYSIKNDEWLVEPVRKKPNVDVEMVKKKANSFIDMIERAEDLYDDKKYKDAYDFSLKLVKKIKKFRQSGLEDKGEFSNENLAFKYLRNNEFIDLLFKLRTNSYDKMMSLEDNYEKRFKIYVSQPLEDEKPGFDRLQELEKFQKNVEKRHSRMKYRLTGHGKGPKKAPYNTKISYKRGKSAPPMA